MSTKSSFAYPFVFTAFFILFAFGCGSGDTTVNVGDQDLVEQDVTGGDEDLDLPELEPETDPCDPNPCKGTNKTTCQANGSDYVCLCDTGYVEDTDTGDCVEAEYCTAEFCNSHGRCDDTSGTAICECVEGYKGDNCQDCDFANGWGGTGESGICTQDKCQWTIDQCTKANKGVCTWTAEAGVVCLCDDGYYEDNDGVCQLEAVCTSDTCHGHGDCSVVNHATECACYDGYLGDACNTCDEASGYHADGMGGCTTDPCLPNPCTTVGKQRCITAGENYTCECSYGYHLDGGTCMIDTTCRPETCSFHGTCALVEAVPTCTCDFGFDGQFCSECLDGYRLLNNQCVPSCVDAIVEFDENNTFEVHDSTVGAGNDVSITSASDSCFQWPVDGPERTYMIQLYAGDVVSVTVTPTTEFDPAALFLLPECSLENACVAGVDGNGETDPPDLAESMTGLTVAEDGLFFFSVDSYYPVGETYSAGEYDLTITFENDSACRGNTECAALYRECVDQPDETAACGNCLEGYHEIDGQDACEIDEACLPTSCGGGHGDCTVEGGYVVCACHDGYTGQYCETCDDGYHELGGECLIDEFCGPASCSGHGVCTDEGGIIVCACHDGYAGQYCDSCAPGYHYDQECIADSDCLATSCNSHGECADDGDTISCTCADGWTGANCTECADGYELVAGDCVQESGQ